jgi:catechol 2,3-dioxygenase
MEAAMSIDFTAGWSLVETEPRPYLRPGNSLLLTGHVAIVKHGFVQSHRGTKRRMALSRTNQTRDAPFTVDPQVRIGHVHLKVADLERALKFYSGVLGLGVTQRLGDGAAFLSAGGYHHHIGLNTWESHGGSSPPIGTTGLYHTAILYPSRAALADAFRRVLAAGIPLDGAADHGVSESIYLRDPDGNGVELYWDKPQQQWPRTRGGALAMFTHQLDLKDLVSEASSGVRLSSGPRDL